MSGAQIVRTALKYVGYPYTATGNSPSTGFSCIGFASFVYRQNGIPLPGDLADALAYAPQVSLSNLEPGDLLFFQNTVWNGLSHVAIYIGGGKMVHARWYDSGVVITSINNDARDGNYWPAHFLAANRPWTGAAGGTVVPTTPAAPTTPPGTVVGSAPSVAVPNAPTGTVTSPSGLRLRSAPSTSAGVLQVLAPGTTVYIVGSQGSYYKVQLADGTLGWVSKSYVTKAGAASTTVGNPTAPSRIANPGTTKRQGVITVKATTLNVRSGPSSTAAVVGSVAQGQKLVVIGQSSGWYKVQLPDGSVGWVSASFVSGKPKTKVAAPPKAPTTGAGSSTASAAVNVRSAPSTSSTVLTVIPVGGSYQILGWKNGWAKVRLPNGQVGWVSGTVIGGSSTTYSSKTGSTVGKGTKASSGSYTHTITAGVNVRAGAGTKYAVVGAATSGAKVQILGYKNGWAHVRLPSGVTGYVLGTYVR